MIAGHALAVGTTDAAASDVGSAMAVASTAAEKQGELSACAKQCFAVAQSLGFDQVAADSLACYMPYKRKRLSTYDCCDKVGSWAAHQQQCVATRLMSLCAAVHTVLELSMPVTP